MKKNIKYIIALGAIVLLSACSQAPQPPNITLFEAAIKGDLDATKQHIAAGTNLEIPADSGFTITVAQPTAYWCEYLG